MGSWGELEEAEPDLMTRIAERFDANAHKTLATLRRDGSPRISGIESQVVDGELYIGSMWNGVKALDLIRDGRFALHSGSIGGDGWEADAKIAGVAVEVTEPDEMAKLNGVEPGRAHGFRLDITEATHVGLDPERTKLVIDTWTAEGGRRRIER